MMSSSYTITDLNRSDDRMMSRWNDAGALRRTNGIRVNCYKPWCDEEVVLCRSDYLINICQYPELQSSAEKTSEVARESINSSI